METTVSFFRDADNSVFQLIKREKIALFSILMRIVVEVNLLANDNPFKPIAVKAPVGYI